MGKVGQEQAISPHYAGDERPVYIEPKIKYPSYGQYSNAGEVAPAYSMDDRGYVEYR